LIILWPKNQQNFFSKKKLSKNTQKIEALYLIRLGSDSLGKPMGWALMGWKNPIWKPNPIGPTLMGWAGTFVQNPTRRPPYLLSFVRAQKLMKFYSKFLISFSREQLNIDTSLLIVLYIKLLATENENVINFSSFKHARKRSRSDSRTRDRTVSCYIDEMSTLFRLAYSRLLIDAIFGSGPSVLRSSTLE
jgi:hypothetical protein